MMDLLNKVATIALLGFVVSSMMAMGVGFTVRQIIDALRDVRLVLLALLVLSALAPAGGYGSVSACASWRIPVVVGYAAARF